MVSAFAVGEFRRARASTPRCGWERSAIISFIHARTGGCVTSRLSRVSTARPSPQPRSLPVYSPTQALRAGIWAQAGSVRRWSGTVVERSGRKRADLIDDQLRLLPGGAATAASGSLL